jgi:hypothetical protein
MSQALIRPGRTCAKPGLKLELPIAVRPSELHRHPAL